MNEEPRFDLLDDLVIRIHTPTEPPTAHSLPEVFALLASEAPIEFSGLQAHQSHAWHAFLCQLGALALHRAGKSTPDVTSAREWRTLLTHLTAGSHEAWCLVVPDLAQPAFFQPPVPEGSLEKWKNVTTEPDVLDLLVTAKNHDLKRRRIAYPAPEHWVFALTSLQTSDGFGGQKNYGIARMNGGYGNRAGIGVAGRDEPSARFRRDCSLLLERRAQTTGEFGFDDGGTGLLWLEPWDGSWALPISRCDPFVIEICRRVRLSAAGLRIIARYVGTSSPRIQTAETKGNLGDVWVPVRRKDGAALTAKNLSYNLLQDVLFGADYEPSPASMVREGDGDHPVMIAKVLVRGQGKTEGYFERTIPYPPKAKRMLVSREGRQTFGALARERVELAASAKNRVLKPAVLTLLQGGPDQLNFDDRRIERFSERFEQLVDDVFFPALFDGMNEPPMSARRRWVETLLERARHVLGAAIDSAPIPLARKYRAIVLAERVFYGSARKNFPDNFAGTLEGDVNAARSDTR